jgi:hypothetical protein
MDDDIKALVESEKSFHKLVVALILGFCAMVAVIAIADAMKPQACKVK